MSKRLSDDEKRFYTDQITMLKGENERLTKIVEDLEEELEATVELSEAKNKRLNILEAETAMLQQYAEFVFEKDYGEVFGDWLDALKEGE